jgi:hypothetical protein
MEFPADGAETTLGAGIGAALALIPVNPKPGDGKTGAGTPADCRTRDFEGCEIGFEAGRPLGKQVKSPVCRLNPRKLLQKLNFGDGPGIFFYFF